VSATVCGKPLSLRVPGGTTLCGSRSCVDLGVSPSTAVAAATPAARTKSAGAQVHPVRDLADTDGRIAGIDGAVTIPEAGPTPMATAA
jgi:hypothetical protein